MDLRPGSTFGPYRIVGPLGRGGMASVYRAYEESLDRHVALKVLHAAFASDASFAERFRREAKLVARLEHPHIVPIHAFGIEGATPWMATRLITGGTLASLLRERRLGAEEVVGLIAGVASALDYAHANGIIHRDVKPQNMLLDESRRVYLADFGIARMLEAPSHLTAAGTIQGTPAYMAPEQASGQLLDPRCDVYALGIVAYEALTGRVPFTGPTPMSILLKHVSEPVPLPSPSEVGGPLVAALHKALAKRPEERWSSATAFAAALGDGLRGGGTAPAEPASPPPAPGRPLLPWLAGLALLGAAAVVALALGIGVYLATDTTPSSNPSSRAAATTIAPVATSPSPALESRSPRPVALRSPVVAAAPVATPTPAAPTPAPADRAAEANVTGPVRVFCEAALHPEFFSKAKAEDVMDSAQDLRKTIGRRKTLELAESRERADIVLQVLERGRAPALVGRCQVRVRLLFGAEAFEILGQDSFAGMNTWGGAAGGAADRVESWVKANYERVMRRRKG